MHFFTFSNSFQVVTNGDYPSGYTYALTDYNNEIIAGGGFKHASNGDTLNCIARYDENIAAPVMQVNNISYGPNPTTNQIHLNYLPANAIIQIQNINGQTLLQTKAQNNAATIDVSNLPAGIYLIEIQSDQGITVKKFVKE